MSTATVEVEAIVTAGRSASLTGGWRRRNFSMIIDLPLFVAPISSRFGIRCLPGHANSSSSRSRAAVARG